MKRATVGLIFFFLVATPIGHPALAQELAQERGWLGVQVETSVEGEKSRVRVVSVVENGPASKAAILTGDIVVSIDGTAAQNADRFALTIGARRPHAEVRLQILRGGEERTITATLGERPKHANFQRISNGDMFSQATYQNLQFLMESEASEMLTSAAVTLGAGGTLAGLLRERQGLQAKVLANDKLKKEAERAGEDEKHLIEESNNLLAQRNALKQRLAKEFPEYNAFAETERVNLPDTQMLLEANEALVMFIDMASLRRLPGENQSTLIYVITKTDVSWGLLDISSSQISAAVEALRCGLDYRGKWLGGEAERCIEILKPKALPNGPSTLPFDLARAHELYTDLFGDVEDLIKGKHLLIVASGPLTALPFHVLVTEKPAVAIPSDPAAYANAAWLAKRQPITVIPSLGSLKALRQFAKTSRAANPFIGFGNPLLTGADGKNRQAWARQSCPKPSAGVGLEVASIGTSIVKLVGRGADVEDVRRQPPLPETTDELCAVARTLGAETTTVHLGERATERAVKALSRDGTLANSRVVHFATHGLLARETESLTQSTAEPALMLTPPDQATDEDDGLLTASEIMQLKLDADWVIMSACNTAAGEKAGSEAFSGLARAFFMAGARALLVSHWYVSSDAAVILTTGAFNALKQDPTIGRTEALRRSMLALIARGGRNAHPANWAPFVVVGEGEASKRGSSSTATVGAAGLSSVATAVSGEPGAVATVNAAPKQPEAKKKLRRRRKPAGNWDWLSDLWGQ
jgi:CHAT domain-containing protein